MKITKIIPLIILSFSIFLTGCEGYLEPNPDNRITLDDVISSPEYAEGFLMKAYKGLPTNYDFMEDITSDDATTNVPSSNAVTMNAGGWNASFNPISAWDNAYNRILYLNTFLENMDGVEWSWENTTQNELFAKKLRSEAHALRAWYDFMLLQNHAGVGSNGELLGFPIVDKVLSQSDDYEIPRAKFADCVKFILDDCDSALENLPDSWENTGDAIIDQVNGARNLNRITGMAVRLLKSKVVLYAASPSYAASGYTMQNAAVLAADVISRKGGLGTLKASDLEFYNDPSSSEILWASSKLTDQTNWESNNFPPSLFGAGNTNPSQNLVDAFPAADGTPVAPGSSYENRDPRLAKYILFNGSNFHGGTINTYQTSGVDVPGADKNSTKTGYYLRKFMQEGVDIDPALSSPVGGQHFYTYARFTEALLNFAEAANEAVGPDEAIEGYTAREVINTIRTRAGITSTAYVDGLDQNGMRQLIRNERRIELCFEGQRFWDIRRWGLTNVMKDALNGISISADQSSQSVINVESRKYEDYQVYGPIPYSETLKYDIIQNEGY